MNRGSSAIAFRKLPVRFGVVMTAFIEEPASRPTGVCEFTRRGDEPALGE
jgi:hypothetical protein